MADEDKGKPEEGGQQAGGAGDGIGAAASQAYTEALEGGSTPQEAFDAATGAAQEMATEMGVPQGDFEQGLEAATQAFGEATEGGAGPGEAFGKQAMVQGKGSQFGQLQGFLLKNA